MWFEPFIKKKTKKSMWFEPLSFKNIKQYNKKGLRKKVVLMGTSGGKKLTFYPLTPKSSCLKEKKKHTKEYEKVFRPKDD